MKKIFQYLLTPVFFKVVNGKYIKIEIQYIAWSIACFFMAYRSGETVNGGLPDTFGEYLRTLLFALPFLLMVFLVIRAWLKPSFYTLFDIPKEWWITRLNLSMQNWFTLTEEEAELKRQLTLKFVGAYGVAYKHIKPHWIYYAQIGLLIGLSILGFFLGK